MFKVILTWVKIEETLSFESLIPDKGTIQVMRGARKVKLDAFDNIDDLKVDLTK